MSLWQNSKYIVFEGTDGSGKTTIAEAIYKQLPGNKKIFTKEPGSPHLPFCKRVRELVLHGSEEGIDPITYAYLFAADTYEHMTKLVEPYLKKDFWVVSDRSVLSDFAYRPNHGDHIRQGNYNRFISLNPKVFWVDTMPSVCQSRMNSREEPLNQFEKKHVIDKLHNIRDAYHRCFTEDMKVPRGDHRAWYLIPNNHDLQSAIDTVMNYLTFHFKMLSKSLQIDI